MQLTVLGCAGTFPSAESGCSAYLFEHEGFRLLVDCGNGAIGALQRHVGLTDVDAVLLSHLHADHCVDLVAYSYALRFHPEHPPRLPVYGPKGTQDRLCQIFEQPPRDRLEKVYDFRITRPGGLELGPFAIELARTAHPIETHAMRITADNRSVAYSADTGETDNLVEVARGVDLFLCEASWLDGAEMPKGVHLTARQAGEHAHRAEVGRLALTHTIAYDDHTRTLSEATREYSGPTELVRAGQTYQL